MASAKQLFYVTLVLSCAIGAVCVAFNAQLLHAIYGSVEPDVMREAETYFWISALSYPFIAVYNAGAALFRSMGNSRVSLAAALMMNVINIGGNAALIYGFGWGVAGAATASLFSRLLAAAVLVVGLLMNRAHPIYFDRLWQPCYDAGMVKSILRVGVPTGLENGMFQIGKLLVAGIITAYGTSSITANAICNNISVHQQHPRQRHRPGRRDGGGPVRRRGRHRAGAQLRAPAFGADAPDDVPHKRRGVPALARHGGILRHAGGHHVPRACVSSASTACSAR